MKIRAMNSQDEAANMELIRVLLPLPLQEQFLKGVAMECCFKERAELMIDFLTSNPQASQEQILRRMKEIIKEIPSVLK